jgi:hypothetical protein
VAHIIEWHVLLWNNQPADAFLPVSTCKLIADLYRVGIDDWDMQRVNDC